MSEPANPSVEQEQSAFNLYGHDLFGNPVDPGGGCKLADDFIVPPFSVLSAREGDWQRRKQAWLACGIKGELSREGSLYKSKTRDLHFYDRKTAYEAEIKRSVSLEEWTILYDRRSDVDKGTSIFDPVLCELSYRWYVPSGGMILDPFAGGSVRGIVAAMLGYKYWGCDLRQEQIEANRQQARDICPEAESQEVTVSGPMLRQMFHPCESAYITGTCQGRCCQGSDGIMVTIHPSEQRRVQSLGATIDGGFIRADERGLCPFKTDEGFCRIHGDEKPFGCKASPFTLNKSDTLVVRNRYRLLRCYNCDGALPAYAAHRWSLEQIFGVDEAARICAHAEAGTERIAARMPFAHYAMLHDNDCAKTGECCILKRPPIEWVCGDAMDLLDSSPPADFIFSCPPYGDLERYSDDPRDLSTMEYHTFIGAYRRIILKACTRLKNHRFACFVVGDFRDPKTGHYRNFVADTIESFRQCGLGLYNEAILVTAVGSLPIRVGKQFTAGRKLGKTHQNILTFVKGDWREAARAAGPLGKGYEYL